MLRPRPVIAAKAAMKPTEDYANEHSNQAKLQAHARLMLLMAAREVKPHIDSPSATNTILTKVSPYFHGEIAKITSRTNQCQNSSDFYTFIGVNKPEKFHVELTDKVCASLRQAWASYSAKRPVRSGTDFYNFVNKRIAFYAPRIETVGKRFEIVDEPVREPIGRAKLLPPVRPPVVKVVEDGPPGLTEFVETKKEMPALVPLKKEEVPVEKPMPALVPIAKEKPMPALVPLKEDISKPMPELVPISKEKSMPALVPLENAKPMPELVPIEADEDETIAGPRSWFREKRAQRHDKAGDKSDTEADILEAKAKAARKKADAEKAKAAAGRTKVKEELPVKPIAVKWLSRYAKGKDGVDPISLEAGKTYTFMAPSDAVINALIKRQQERGTTFNKRLFLQNHLSEFDLRGQVNANFKTVGGVQVAKKGSQIVNPALANPSVVSSSLHIINDANVVVLVHDNVLPVKAQQ
jgi:hypothetical protein